jgi:hypothetical protein
MIRNTDYLQHTQPDSAYADAHAYAHKDAEDSLQQAVTLVHHVFRHLTTGNLTLTVTEANNMHAHLQELVLQAAAVGGRIREQQAGQAPRQF